MGSPPGDRVVRTIWRGPRESRVAIPNETDQRMDEPAAGRATPARQLRLDSLEEIEAELKSLDKAAGELLAQRGELHDRVKAILDAASLPADESARAHAALEALADNAFNFEVWVSEYRQIAETLIAEDRRFLDGLLDAQNEAGAIAEERDRLQRLVETLEAGREIYCGRIERQTQEIEELRDAAKRSAELIEGLETEISELRVALAAPRRETPETRTPGGPAGREEFERKYQALAAEREKDRRKHAEEVAALTRRLTEVRERYEEQIAQMTARYAQLSESVADKDRQQQPRRSTNKMPLARPVAPAAPGGGVAAQRPPLQVIRAHHQRAEPPPRGEPAAPKAPAATRQFVVFDDDRIGVSASELGRSGCSVTPFVPSAELVERLPADAITCLGINLALSQSWRVARMLRGPAGVGCAAIVAYAVASPTPTGFWFGPIDFVTLPAERGVLVDTLHRMGKGIKQAIIVTPDEDLSRSISQVLRREKVTCAMARDRFQALEALKTSYPQVAIVHPASNPVDVFRAVAAVRGVSLFRRIPIIFLLDERPQAREESLYSAAVRAILRLGDVQAHELAATLAATFSELTV